MTDAEFALYYEKYKDAISGMARKLARSDHDLFDDLVSSGMIRLWQLDVSKASTNLDSWIRTALRNAMIDFLRQQRLTETESLTVLLAAGHQVVRDPDTGLPQLVECVPLMTRKENADFFEHSSSNEDREDMT